MKHTRLVPLFIILFLGILLVGCIPGGLPAIEEEYEATEEIYNSTNEPIAVLGENGQIARQHLDALTDIGARWSGSEEETEAGQYITGVFDGLGYGSEFQPFTAVSEDGETINSANIIAVKDGQSSRVIVVGAHYDSSDEGLGTDDNASGVAVMLEVAELVADEVTPYTIYFIAFGAEEAGLLGSDAFVSSLSDSEAPNITLFVNLDSVSAGDIAYIYSPENEDATARDWAMDWADSNGYDLQTVPNVNLSEDGSATGDYAAFEEAGIPWVYFEATNWTLGDHDGYTQVDPQFGNEGAIIHTQYDNLDYLDETFPGRVDEHLDLFVTVLYNILTQFEYSLNK